MCHCARQISYTHFFLRKNGCIGVARVGSERPAKLSRSGLIEVLGTFFYVVTHGHLQLSIDLVAQLRACMHQPALFVATVGSKGRARRSGKGGNDRIAICQKVITHPQITAQAELIGNLMHQLAVHAQHELFGATALGLKVERAGTIFGVSIILDPGVVGTYRWGEARALAQIDRVVQSHTSMGGPSVVAGLSLQAGKGNITCAVVAVLATVDLKAQGARIIQAVGAVAHELIDIGIQALAGAVACVAGIGCCVNKGSAQCQLVSETAIKAECHTTDI